MNNNNEELVAVIATKVKEKLQQRGYAEEQGTPSNCDLCITDSPDNCAGCGHCVVLKPEAIKNIIDHGADRIGSKPGKAGQVNNQVAALIDHTLLKPEATREQLKTLCDEAKKYGFATVCVNAVNIRYAAAQLEGSRVKPIAVVGFPLGATTPQTKAFETKDAIRNGAREIDMVINIGALKSRDYRCVLEDIQAIVRAAGRIPVKVIIEAASLNDEEKVIACTLSKIAGAAFVKTSTGFGKGGATVKDITLMRAVVGKEMGVKASGGIHSAQDAKDMMAAGANRIGASASVAIVTGGKGSGKY